MSAEPGISAREAATALAASAMDGQETWKEWDPALGAGRARLVDPDDVGNICGGAAALSGLPLAFWRRRRR
jgi:hypothetical protein